MNDSFPVTLNKPAVHDIPLANWNATENPIKNVPMYNPTLDVAARMESNSADVMHPDIEPRISFVGSTYLDINIPLDLPNTKAPK